MPPRNWESSHLRVQERGRAGASARKWRGRAPMAAAISLVARACKGFVANRFCGMNSPQEMHVFNKSVCRDDPIGMRARPQNRPIVSNTGTYPGRT